LDESLVNYYDEQLVSQADTIYRFAFALTLSLDGALECTRRTYRDVVNELGGADGDGGDSLVAATSLLVAACWQSYLKMKGQKFPEGQSAVTRALKPLAVEARAALVAVDVAGLPPAEAAKALTWSEPELRKQLAEARRTLMTAKLDL
jgi:hypothetical protein